MKRPMLLFVILSGVLIMAEPLCAATVIEKALLTPKNTTLWIKSVITPEGDTISFDLPPQAITETLNIQILEPGGISIGSLWEEWLEERQEKELRELMEKIKTVERERDAIKTSQDVINAEIESWKEQSRKRYGQPQDVFIIMEEARKRLEELYKRSLQVAYDLRIKNEELEQLNNRLKEMTGNKKKTRRVYCKLLGFSGKEGEITVRYWFTMNESRWRPVYRLELFPSEERLSFIWEAEINQHSGLDWTDVDVTLATSEPTRFLQPPELPPWIIEPIRPVPRKQYGEGRSMMKAVPSAPADIAAEEVQPEVSQEEKSTFSLYHLGKHTIASGKTSRLRVMNSDWPVKVQYLLRPFVSPWAFIQARVNFEKPFHIPQGEGIFFLEGTFVSKSQVSVQGLSHVFSFGSDPLVSSKLIIEERQTGKKGFLKGKQTFLWKWYYEIENSHSHPITLRFEERKPQARDERIEIKFTEIPSLKELEECSPDRWCWEVPVKEKEKQLLRFTIQVEAPEEMEIFPGW